MNTTTSRQETRPTVSPDAVSPDARAEVSVVMANYNGARWLSDAIRSVQAQTLTRWELLIADDASTDDSLSIMHAAAARDPRIVVLPAVRNQGPSGARNRALDAARGQWVTIVDSDDLIAPGRLAALVDAARRDAASIVADDLRIVDEDGTATSRTLLTLSAKRACDAVDLVKNAGELGYLKPMFDRRVIESLRYDDELRVGEDFDFLLRALAATGGMTVYPELGYLYRQRTSSLSKGSARRALEGMLVADQRFRATQRASGPLLSELDRRRSALKTRLHWENVKASLREKRVVHALREAVMHPGIAHYALGSLFKFAAR
ncbi:glycosyltransferase family 2 protein [Paraburkholderia rhizosphaerae]|uniref:Succinoglycan biosynthesis protein ExoO n=1 Tax=Paraburkholderia rhizosphaerae TaxID=480658 RepID=A0A4R8LXI6_9BURK|nr:glycosyltransferase family 2 protein [Paraburkholderia rhizosphaerae]TDY52801.1 succinoglycan biosynthesis protein ExoO [Paraburkholderia rhizosphaerae]